MLKRAVLIIMVAAILVSGCSPVPEPGQFGYTNQPKMQAVHHWEVLADDVALRIKARMYELYGYEKFTGSFYVTPNETKTPFSQSFHDLLIAGLLKIGMTVVPEKTFDAKVITYDVKVVEHKVSRRDGKSETKIGQVLREGITVVRDVVTLGVLNVSNVPHTEVMITSSIVENKEYLLHQSDIYYVNDPDASHYGGAVTVPKKMSVVGQ